MPNLLKTSLLRSSSECFALVLERFLSFDIFAKREYSPAVSKRLNSPESLRPRTLARSSLKHLVIPLSRS